MPPALLANLILNTDSYKASHFLQYPPGATGLFAYIEARRGVFAEVLFFGLQAFLKEYLAKPITGWDIDEAEDLLTAHGEPFNRVGWQAIVDHHGGYLPIRIRAVAEGSHVPTGQVLLTVESTDPASYWVVSYIETALLRAVWYPSTVASLASAARAIIQRYLKDTSDQPEAVLPFMLHDFGPRGASSAESAALGGLAHLVSFMGTDNLSAILAGRRYYGESLAGYSIPAAEHSTITAWGREGELDAYRNMLTQFGKPGSALAVVSDSYDLYHAIEDHWGQSLRERVMASGARVVIRPDSGKPADVVLRSAILLERAFGTTINARGFKVLNHVRLIQGDGINNQTIADILAILAANRFAAENITFGMGAGLLQQVDRDTLGFAMKTSAICISKEWRDVYKQPLTDLGKASKRGRLGLARQSESGAWQSYRLDAGLPSEHGPWQDALETIWENGALKRDWHFQEIRDRARSG